MGGRLDGKVAVITGAARGMGLATAQLFAREGAKVVMTDLLREDGEAAANAIGDSALFVAHDVTDEAQWRAVAETATARFGGADILINNAGVLLFKDVLDVTRAEFARILDINVLGTFLGVKAIAPLMLKRGGGAIVNISSADGINASNGASPYTASKFAVRGFTKSCALELGHRGIRVNSIHPGAIDTPMTNPTGADFAGLNAGAATVPLQRFGRASEVAEASLYLASEAASYCNGMELVIDGGMLAGRYYAGLPGAPPSMRGG
jgi:3alpha(or 20beta)-hydroxysteroid dehydrogenase